MDASIQSLNEVLCSPSFQNLYDLARVVGTPLAERDAWESWSYDGKTIALIESTPDCLGNRPLYIRPERALLHEICHAISVSDLAQLNEPEFGLGWVIPGVILQNSDLGKEGRVDKREQRIQECVTRLCENTLGPKMGVSAMLYPTPEKCFTWEWDAQWKETVALCEKWFPQETAVFDRFNEIRPRLINLARRY